MTESRTQKIIKPNKITINKLYNTLFVTEMGRLDVSEVFWTTDQMWRLAIYARLPC